MAVGLVLPSARPLGPKVPQRACGLHVAREPAMASRAAIECSHLALSFCGAVLASQSLGDFSRRKRLCRVDFRGPFGFG